MAPHRSASASVQPHRLAAKLPALLQQDITIHRPYPGHGETYIARVLAVDHIQLKISLPRRLAGNGYLRESAPVIVNFVIGDILYEAEGKYRADDRRTRELTIDGDITPTSRRRFNRTKIQIRTGYAPVSNLRLSRGQLANLNWKTCRTLDISAGGVLLQLPFQPPVKAHFLLNLEISGFEEPMFVFGQVQWGNGSDHDRSQYICGIRFVVKEMLDRHFSARAVSELPALVLGFTRNKQRELDRFLEQESSGRSTQGDKNGS
jgi:hypothetical protein